MPAQGKPRRLPPAGRKAVDFDVLLMTNVQFAKRFAEAISQIAVSGLEIKSWEEYR